MSHEKGITRHALASCFMHAVVPNLLHTFGRRALDPAALSCYPIYFQLSDATRGMKAFSATRSDGHVSQSVACRRAPPIATFPCCIRHTLQPYRRGLRRSAARAGVAQG